MDKTTTDLEQKLALILERVNEIKTDIKINTEKINNLDKRLENVEAFTRSIPQITESLAS